MAAQLNNIRLKLEEKRRRIEQDKRRMEMQVNRQRQQLGQQAFLQAVTRVSWNVVFKQHLFLFGVVFYCSRDSDILYRASHGYATRTKYTTTKY